MSFDAYYSESDFGKSVKKYSIGRLLLILGQIITIYITPILETFLTLDFTTITPETIDLGDASILILFGFMGFVFEIIFLVFFFQFTSRMKNIANLHQNQNLTMAFKLEISKIGVFIFTFIGLFIGNLILIYILDLAPLILMLLSAIFIERWLIDIKESSNQSDIIEKSLKSIKILKIGVASNFIIILEYFDSSIITNIGLYGGVIAGFIYAYGLWNLGKSLMEFKSQTIPDYSTVNQYSAGYGRSYGDPTYNQLGHPSNVNNDAASFDTISAENPTSKAHSQSPYGSNNLIGRSKDHCPYCGAPRLDQTSKFCAACGQKFS